MRSEDLIKGGYYVNRTVPGRFLRYLGMVNTEFEFEDIVNGKRLYFGGVQAFTQADI